MTMKRGTRVLLTALCPRCPGEIGKVSSRKQNGWLRVSLDSKRLTVSVRNIAGQVSLLNPQEPTHPEERMRDGVQVDMLWLEQNHQVGSQVDCHGWRQKLIRERDDAYECVKELEREVNFLNDRLALATNIIKEYHESGFHDVEGVEDFIN